MCLKCSKKVSDNSKICRDCGAILQDIPDDAVVVAAAQPEPSEPSTGDEQSVGEFVEDSEQVSPPDREALPWKCSQCGESVPGNFEICWKCRTTKDGEKVDADPVFLEEDLDARKSNEELAPTELDAEPSWMNDDWMEEDKRQSQSVCPRCGSAKMMLGVTVRDQGEVDTTLKVVICGDPSALIFKDRLYGELKADICGDCGHVELRVANQRELYRHYRKSLG
jgi:predicted RNA-binding Zn-ribbon protein involved in translation (DUF1610 family)